MGGFGPLEMGGRGCACRDADDNWGVKSSSRRHDIDLANLR